MIDSDFFLRYGNRSSTYLSSDVQKVVEKTEMISLLDGEIIR